MKVLVVGGGAVGLCCAHALALRDAEVTVLERARCGDGASSGNAGWITPGLSAPVPAPGVIRQALRWMTQPDSPLLVRPRADAAFLAWCWRFARACRPAAHASGTTATLRLAQTAEDRFDALRADGVQFEMHADGLLYLVRDPATLNGWLEAYELLAQQGFDGEITALDAAGVRALEPAVSDDVAGGLLARRERHVRPESLVAGLVARLREMGANILEQRPVRGLRRAGGTWTVDTTAETVRADRVVVAAGVWSREVLGLAGVRVPLEAAKGYSVTAGRTATVPRRPLYLTEAKVGLSPFDEAVRLAGTLELTGVDLSINARRLEAILRSPSGYLRDWRPEMPRVDWAGLRPLAPDGVPIVGAVPGRDGLYVATAHAMLGITLAPSTGHSLARTILEGSADPALAGLGPERFGASHATP